MPDIQINNRWNFEAVLEDLVNTAAMAHFKGYDPYDFAETNLKLPHSLLSKFSFLNKISPVNFRPLLLVKRTDNAKANGLWLWSMVKADRFKYEDEIQFLVNWINKNVATEFDQFSMGFSFKMALTRYASGPGKTSLIISLFVLFPLILLYSKTGDPAILQKILSFENLLESTWMKFETGDEIWYSYLPAQKDEVYNATAKVGRFYANLYRIHKQARYLEIIKKVLNYLRRVQEDDGRWIYSPKAPYVDNFHTAFILESIFEMNRLNGNAQSMIMFDKGLRYYMENCFSPEFIPLHFSKKHGAKDIRNKILGTEIRDCANAIIFFSKIGKKEAASKIMNWTMKNFYNEKKKYFSFFKNDFFTNKLCFVRWQAWMALAIAEYNKYHPPVNQSKWSADIFKMTN